MPVRVRFLPCCWLVVEQRLLLLFFFDNPRHSPLIPAQIVEQQLNAVRERERLSRQRAARRGFIPVGFRFQRDPP